MNFYGRIFAQMGLAAAISLGAAAAQAQTYPARNIIMIVPFAAGGPTDVIARIVTGQMAPGLGQSVIIENVVGAGGTTGATRAAQRRGIYALKLVTTAPDGKSRRTTTLKLEVRG